MSKLIESITQLAIHGLHIRVWRYEDNYDLTVEKRTCRDLTKALAECVKVNTPPTRSQVADALFNVDRVNAVEVKDNNGMGVVLYKDWP